MRTVGVAFLVVISICLMNGLAFSQTGENETVFSTAVNNKIVQIVGESTVELVNDAGSNFRDLLVRADLHFVVADHNQNGHVEIFNTDGEGQEISENIAFPFGLSESPSGDIWVVNGSAGSPDSLYRLRRDYLACPATADPVDPVACPQGGYVTEILRDVVVDETGAPTTRLVDTAVVRFNASQGSLRFNDVLVLAAEPAKLLRYFECSNDPSGLCGPELITDEFAGLEPTAMAFGRPINPAGGDETLLVATEQGIIRQFSVTGTALQEVTVEGGGKIKGLAVGIQDGVSLAFATVQPDELQVFGFTGGVGIDQNPQQIVSGLDNPHGVNLATGSASPLQVGGFTQVQLASLLATYDQVDETGHSVADCAFFADPGMRPFNLSAIDSLPSYLKLDIEVPEYVDPFMIKGTTIGVFRVCMTTVTAAVTGVVEYESDELEWLGYSPDEHDQPGTPSCKDPVVTNQSRTLYSPEPETVKNEYPIIEWSVTNRNVFTDISIGCASDVSWSRGRASVLLFSVKDSRQVTASPAPGCEEQGIDSASCDIISYKLAMLRAALETSSLNGGTETGGLADFILDSRLARRLVRRVESAERSFSSGNTRKLLRDLDDLLEQVDGAKPSGFDNSRTDVQAELRVRANSLLFMACKLEPAAKQCRP